MLQIKKNEILAPYMSFRIGGSAKEFTVVENIEDLEEAIDYAKNNNEEIFIFGGGSNVLVSDKGFNGLAIKIQNTKYKIQDLIIECDSGLAFPDLVNISKENGLSGLEWAIGIPGTIGGAIRGNAGAYGSEIENIVSEVTVFDMENNKTEEYSNERCNFGYRNSIFKQNNKLVIVSARLKFEKIDKSLIKNKIKEIAKKRANRIPTNWKGSAGSFFENPICDKRELIEEFERETGAKAQENRIPAGWLIDKAGLKGKKIGNVMVNEVNSNFIVNAGGGTAEQVIMLASIIKQKVQTDFGLQLKEEVQYVGF